MRPRRQALSKVERDHHHHEDVGHHDVELEILDRVGEDEAVASRTDDAERRTPPALIPGALEMFQTLRGAGVKVALQTGYAAPVANSIMASLHWTVGETVDALVTSDTVAASRPAPYLIFHAMESTGVRDVRRVLTAGEPHTHILDSVAALPRCSDPATASAGGTDAHQREQAGDGLDDVRGSGQL